MKPETIGLLISLVFLLSVAGALIWVCIVSATDRWMRCPCGMYHRRNRCRERRPWAFIDTPESVAFCPHCREKGQA